MFNHEMYVREKLEQLRLPDHRPLVPVRRRRWAIVGFIGRNLRTLGAWLEGIDVREQVQVNREVAR